jgi:uncharacterized membrane protein
VIRVEWLYWVVGLVFLAVAVLVARDRENPRRWGSAAFWGLLGLGFGYGTLVSDGSAPAWLLGIAVIALAVLAGLGYPVRGGERTTTMAQRERFAERFGGRLFVPALVIPAVAVLFGAVLVNVKVGSQPLLEKGFATIIGLGVAALVAVAVALVLLRPAEDPPSPVTALHEGRRLLKHIGWAAVLPQMLATLGLLFTASGVGQAVGRITNGVLPKGSLIAAVALYCVGMALFTVIMGNAFAAFPVMTAAVGWPLLVQQFHGNPATVFAVGMLAGFCGTLCTPMAANFNLVPAALLEMRDTYGPIKAQVPTAVPLLLANIVIMYASAF